MAEENEKPESDVLKSIRDRLAELEDLQLVNKLDIINVKNELDKASLTGGPSPETSEKVEELSRLVEKSENLKKAEKMVGELEKLRSEFGKGRPAEPGKARADLDAITREIKDLREKVRGIERRVPGKGKVDDSALEELRERISRLESAKPHEIKTPRAGIPRNIAERMDEIKDISSEIESLRRQLEEQKTAISGLEREGPPGPVPKELEERIKRLESGAVNEPEAVPEDLEYRVKMLEEAVGDESKPKTVVAKPAKALLDRLDRLEGHLNELDAIKEKVGKAGAKPARGGPGNVEEVKNMLQSLRQQVTDQGKELVDLKSSRGTESLLKVDEMKEQLESIKSQISAVEESAAKAGMAPDALEELRKLKGQFPVEEFHELKKKMDAMEQKLDTVSKLASGLKPIELPKGGTGGPGGPSKELEGKVKELERLVGEGVSAKRFKGLERRMEEMREWLPEYIANDINHRIEDFRKELKTKVSEVNELKEEIIEHTIEQLLAQPGHVSKLIGDKLKSQLDELQRKVSQLDNVVKPSDAKLTTLLKDFDGAKRELEKEKQILKDMQEKNKMDLESLAVELKALNTKVSSFEKKTKDIEATGLSGVARDLEILKTRTDWLESTLHKLDLDQIYQKIEDLEDRMHVQRSYSPHVIE
jgi:DNA repair exonuclease SbcCD ATPase subunit